MRLSVKRPDGISILAILCGIFGALTLLGGLVLPLKGEYAVGNTIYLGSPPSLIGFEAIVAIITGIVLLAISTGLWKGKRWGWWIAVAFAALNLISSLADAVIFAHPIQFVDALVYLLIAFYLIQKSTKTYFGMA